MAVSQKWLNNLNKILPVEETISETIKMQLKDLNKGNTEHRGTASQEIILMNRQIKLVLITY